MKDTTVTAIDIGSRKISVSIGVETDQELDIINSFTLQSEGIVKGFIEDEEACFHSIKAALEKAMKFNSDPSTIFVGVSSVSSRVREISSSVNLRSGKVTFSDVKRAIEKAKRQIVLENGEEVLDVYINYFTLDNKLFNENILGYLGNILSLNLSIIICQGDELQKYKNIFKRCNVNVEGFTLSTFSTRKVFLSEKTALGDKVLIDIGGGTTDVLLYNNGVLKELFTIGISGDNITKDLSICGKFSYTEGEKIKKMFSSDYERLHKEEMEVVVGTTSVSTELVYLVTKARIDEIFEYVNLRLKKTSFQDGICSIIIYGDGISSFEKVDFLAKEKFDFKTKVVQATSFGLQDFSTIASLSIIKDMYDRKGLIRESVQEEYLEGDMVLEQKQGIVEKIKTLLGEIF